MFLQVLLFILAIVILYFGAEMALESAEKIGLYFGLSPLVIGLLIVGFGTSLPEFFVSQISSYNDHSGIAMGNIIGSNIANVFLIMGVSGLLAPLRLNRKIVFNQFCLHFLLTIILSAILFYQKLNWISCIPLGAFFIYYLRFTYMEMIKHEENVDNEDAVITAKTVLMLILGFTFLYYGGDLLTSSGTKIGEGFGISEYVLSVIFVAFGTSFPELVTALVACYKRKDTDLITGNIIGSNIFNVAFVMGSLGIYNIQIESTKVLEICALLAVSLVLIFLSWKKKVFYRLSGFLFLCSYFAMVCYWIQY